MDINEAKAKSAALRKQLPQWDSDAEWAYNVSKVFAGPGSFGYGSKKKGNYEAMQHQLNMKEQEAEAYDDEVRRQGGRPNY